MTPNKIGQVVKFHTPLPEENPNQLYVVLEIHFDVEKPRAKLKELNGGLPFPSVCVVLVDDLEVAEVNTADLLGHNVNIHNVDKTLASGKVVKVSEKRIQLDMKKGQSGVETNVWLTIEDEKGKEHVGTLFVH